MAKRTSNRTSKSTGRVKADSGNTGPRRTTGKRYGCGGKLSKK
jgi:hypothetical protein